MLAGLVMVLLSGAPVAAQAGKAPAKAPPAPATYPALPSETPAELQPVTASFDYQRREVEIPMRDGVKLHTVILVPRGAKARRCS